jgi:flavin-dependent dehydrogenase
VKQVKLPAAKLDKIEKGFTPYHRAPYSLVTDGFICMGDAACMTKPYSGEGITAS